MQPVSPKTLDPNAQVLSLADWNHLLSSMVTPEFKKDYRRGCQRYPANWDAKCSFEVSGKQILRTVMILEASIKGLTIRTFRNIPADTLVYLEINLGGTPFALKGRIIHCTETVGGFKGGIQLLFA